MDLDKTWNYKFGFEWAIDPTLLIPNPKFISILYIYVHKIWWNLLSYHYLY
jgi:hypothetical protein